MSMKKVNSQAENVLELPSTMELATLAASLNAESSAEKRTDSALRIWLAAKALLERMEVKIRECPEDCQEAMRGAFEWYAHSDKPFDVAFEFKKNWQTVSYDDAKKLTGIHTDKTFQLYLGKVLRGEPTPGELKIERKIRPDDSIHIPTPAELKRDGIRRSVLDSMTYKKRRTKIQVGRKSHAGKRGAGADAEMVKDGQGRQPLKGGKPVK